MRRSAGAAQRPRSTNRLAAVAGRRACTQPVPVRPRWSAAWRSETRGRRGAVAVSRLSCPLVHLSFGEFRFLVASPSFLDLLRCAKHLFVAAILAGPPASHFLYQTAETLTHLCHRRVRAPRPYPIGPPYVFAMNVRVGRSQHESGSASFGISRSDPFLGFVRSRQRFVRLSQASRSRGER